MKLSKERKMLITLAAAAVCAVSMTSCGMVDMLEDNETTTSNIFTTTTTKKPRETSHTTKTGRFDAGKVDDDDEDFDGYETTTADPTQGLENDPADPDKDVDMEMRATQKTDAKTFYTIPEHNGTTASPVTVSEQTTTTEATWKIDLGAETATTTKAETKKEESSKAETTTTTFDPNKLKALTDDLKYGADVKFTVTSDTTYLNLRYGPSRSYSIITTIPDGTEIVCKGETYDSDGDYWVYTSYNGTDGWVLKGLLS